MADWQEELRQKRREVILEAAAKAFAKKGYQRATIKEIAQEAGIAPGTIYLYFDDKRTLLLSIAEQLINLVPQELPDPEPNAAQVRDFIHRLLDERLAMIEEHRAFFHALTAAMWTDDKLRTRYLRQILAPIWEVIESFLEIGMDSGKVRQLDPQIVARSMIGSIFLFTMISEQPPGDYLSAPYRERLVDEMTEFFFQGIRSGEDKQGTN